MSENWNSIDSKATPTEQASELENLLLSKLDEYCPVKTMKLGMKDKPFITEDLKKLARQRNREYLKRGKTEKYLKLRNDFKKKYKIESAKYLEKTLVELRSSKPGKVYSLLKRLGSDSFDNDGNTFTLTSHEESNYSAKQSAELIAKHFAEISGEFPPLCIDNLPSRVKEKIEAADQPPALSDYEV